MHTRLAHILVWSGVFVGYAAAQHDLPELIIPDGHIAPLTQVLLTPDEKYVVTLSADETARLWDLASGSFIRTFSRASRSMAITPNGKFLVTGAPYIFSQDSLIRVWRMDNGQVVHAVLGHDVIAVGPSGIDMLYVRRGPRGMSIWRGGVLVGTSRELFCIDSASAWTATADMERLALGYPDGRIEIRDLSGGVIAAYHEHAEEIVQLSFTRDGQFLLSGGGDRLIKIFSMERQAIERTVWANFYRAFAVDPHHRSIWSSSYDFTVDQYDFESGEWQGLIDHHDYSIAGIALTQDLEYLIEACTDKKLKVIHLPTGRVVRESGAASLFVSHVSVDPTGQYLISSGFDHRIRMWNLQTGEWVRSIPSRDVMQTYVADSLGWMISTVAGPSLEIKTFPAGEFIRMRGYHDLLCYSFALSPSQRRFATGGYDRKIRVYPALDGDPDLTLEGHRGNIMALTFSRDERWLISSAFDEQLIGWDVSSGKSVWSVSSGLVNQLVATSRGTVLGAGQDGRLSEWNIETGMRIRQIDAHDRPISSLAVHSGKIATASEDQRVRVWDEISGRQLFELESHSGAVNSVVFSPDGTNIISAGHEGSVCVWDAGTGRRLATLIGFRDDEWICVMADGRYFGSANADRQLFYRYGNELYSLRQFADLLKVDPGSISLAGPSRVVSLKRPPKVEIARSYAMPRITDGRVTVEIHSRSMEAPLHIRFYVNEELVEDRRVESGTSTMKCEVRLRHGHNQIRVIGINDEGLQSNESKMYVYYD